MIKFLSYYFIIEHKGVSHAHHVIEAFPCVVDFYPVCPIMSMSSLSREQTLLPAALTTSWPQGDRICYCATLLLFVTLGRLCFILLDSLGSEVPFNNPLSIFFISRDRAGISSV